MNLSWLDWTLVALAVVSLRFVSLSTRSCCKGVADFLSANRSAGRYLVTIAGTTGNRALFRTLAHTVRNPNDNGRVEHAPDDALTRAGVRAIEMAVSGAADLSPVQTPATRDQRLSRVWVGRATVYGLFVGR